MAIPNQHRGNENFIFFLLAFIFGSVIIVFVKVYFEGILPLSNINWLAALAAMSIVFALTVYYILNSQGTSEDKFEKSDHIYYLGLLFTLLSLVIMLVDFSNDTSEYFNRERFIRDFGTFGIALSSTIAGIIGRLAVQHFLTESNFEPKPLSNLIPDKLPEDASPSELEEYSKKIRNSIAEDIRKIAIQINHSANEYANFNKTISNLNEENLSYFRKHREMLEQESASYEAMLHQAQNLSKANSHLNELISNIETNLVGAGEAGKNFNVQVNEASKSTQTLGSQIEKLNSTLSDVQATAESVAALKQDFERTANAVEQAGIVLEKTTKQSESYFNVLDRTKDKLNSIANDLKKARKEIQLTDKLTNVESKKESGSLQSIIRKIIGK